VREAESEMEMGGNRNKIYNGKKDARSCSIVLFRRCKKVVIETIIEM